ncbi:MAG: lamin tail domain-containing protein [Verrucomicrobia bacterium]|nr:lamin tail domain-containing protein [Verrucomicrobiota bacterium]MBI3870902.1 lamin tail domain-containing protein [Verrucomicrobiota bacterium]
MKKYLAPRLWYASFVVWLGLSALSFPAAADPSVIISEFLTANVGGRLDQDGDSPDWLEINNPTQATVDLTGWHLSDDPADLAKWTFPATNIGPGKFMLIFASGKNRSVAGAELHTSFQLNSTASYLALIRPDGLTVEFDYSPTYPPQLQNVSYGVIPLATTVAFVEEGKAAKWRVPARDADRPADWTSQAFDDSAWNEGLVPLGFDAGQVVGLAGGATTNLARGKSVTQSSTAPPFSAGLAVDGNLGNFAQTAAGQRLPATWEVSLGTNTLIGEITLYNRGDGSFGSRLRDITVRIISLDSKTTNFTSALLNPENVLGGGGLSGPPTIVLNLTNITGGPVLGGRVRVTRTPDPDLSGTGGQGTADEADVLSLGEVVVAPYVPPLTFKSLVRTDVQSAMKGFGASALVRVPFLVILDNLPTFESLTLRMKYDDGFVAYLNGVKVAEANAPASLSWDSTAVREHPDPAAIQFEDFDITPSVDLLKDGINVLAIQGLNIAAGDDDFLLSPQLLGRSPTVLVPNYFSQPTPGATNQPGTVGVVADTKFSVDRGFFDAPFDVAITSATPGAQIRYTTNGAAPTALSGILYTGPIRIDRTTALRAIATKPGYTSSDVDTHSYIFPAQVVAQSAKSATSAGYPATWAGGTADYAMDPRITTNAANASLMVASLRSLRSVLLTTSISNFFDSAKGIYSNPESHSLDWERPASMEMIDTNGVTEFQANCGVRIQGGYFRQAGVTRKHSFRVLFKSAYGAGRLRYDIFKSDDAVADFDTLVLRAGANDGYAWDAAKDTEQFLRNRFGGDLDRLMGNASTHGIFVHLYLNGLYWGLFELCERPNEDFSASYYGGDALNWDSNNAGDIKNGDLVAWGRLTGVSGTAKTLTDYEKLQGNAPDGSRNPVYPVYLDKQNYIDYMVANIWGGNWDWPNKNFWFGRDRTTNSTGFKFYMWDFENTMGNNRDRSPLDMVSPRSGLEAEWVAQPHSFLKNIIEYQMDFADRVQKHFFNGGVLTPAPLIQRYRVLADGIELAMLSETARWGDDNLQPPQDINAWRRERDWILGTYLPQRSDIVLKQFKSARLYPALSAPTMSKFGGAVSAGFSLALSHTNAAGEIYFTVNGSDPRMIGGALSPGAQLYSGPLTISGNTLIRARVKNSTNWSAIVEAPFTTADYFRDLVISEIMYNPVGEKSVNGDEFEFLELRNLGSGPLDLTGLSFSAGITFSFTNGTQLAAGGTFLLVRDIAAFQTRYPAAVVNGVYSGTLSNNGETLTLSHDLLGTVISFRFNDSSPWPLTPDGYGFSLVLRRPGAGDNPDRASSWQASAVAGGSPGAPEPVSLIPPVVINEVMSRNAAGPDFIELHNPTSADAAVGGWFLTDDVSFPKKYRIADGTVIPPGGFLTFAESQFNPAGSTNAFSLNASGDEVYLFSGNASTNLTGYSHGFKFGTSADKVTFGRYVLSTGDEDFVAQITPTPEAANSGPRIGPVVITEIQYHPAPGDASFVELRNISASPLPLFDVDHPTNTWRLNGAGFVFPQGTTLQPGQFVLVTDLDPAAFRSRYSVPVEAPVFGPYSGSLRNSGELLELQRPDAPGSGKLDFITVDFVRYNDRGGWPSAADGGGPSLQRTSDGAYGNDPIHWVAARSTPGQAWGGGVRPAITSQPQSAVALVSGATNFQVSATSDAPIYYQWRFNGGAIQGAVSPAFALTNLQASQAGFYSVVVYGDGGAAVSSNAFLNVLTPALVLGQPGNTYAVFGSNVSFSVSAVSTTPLTYQWRFNGADIQNATAPTLTLKGLTFQSGGLYTCLIRDGVGPVETPPALLTIVIKPVVVQAPLSLEAPQGGSATFSAVADGTLPLTFRWRKNGIIFTNMILDGNVAFFTISNVQAANSAKYSVVVTNFGGPSPASADALLTILPDTDGDGIPDDWEVRYHLNPNDPKDAVMDADGDTMSNRAEYISGTDPTNSLSYLKVDNINSTLAGVGLEFQARSNRTYSILYRATAEASPWKVLVSLPARSTNRVERVVDPAGALPRRYYRLTTPANQAP